MTTLVPSPYGVIGIAVTRGNISPVMSSGAAFGVFRFPTDPVGIITLRFSGIMAGSELHLFLPDGTPHAAVESAVANQEITVNRFASGNPNNNVRVLIVSLGYENLDFQYELPTSDALVPIFQRIDRNYRNPT